MTEAIKYVDRSNYMEQKYRERFLERHHKRLEEIANKKSTKMRQSVVDIDIGVRLNENKKLIHEIQTSQKNIQIDRENQLLLRKLVEIQSGKRSLIPRSHSQIQLINDYRAKSLHVSKRKIEMERIERENLKIAQKIYELKPMVMISDLE